MYIYIYSCIHVYSRNTFSVRVFTKYICFTHTNIKKTSTRAHIHTRTHTLSFI